MSQEVVITGLGIISPIGIGTAPFWDSLCAGRSGVRRIGQFDSGGLPVTIAGEVVGFEPKDFIKQRKSLKVMSRDAHLGVAASELAAADAGICPGSVDPERVGVILGADRICPPMEEAAAPYRPCIREGLFDFRRWGGDGMAAGYPLAFLRLLPNMIASHVSIALDARGPNNTVHQNKVSALLALAEAARIIRRGAADVMVAGGASSQMTPTDWTRHCVCQPLSRRSEPPASAMRPFDAGRDGTVMGEGAAIYILEGLRHAEKRGARILARLAGWAASCDPARNGSLCGAAAVERAIDVALRSAGLDVKDVGHVNAHGLSTPEHDRLEARALCDVLPGVPVTAPTSFFGNLEAAGGAVELAASVLSFAPGKVPATLNYERPDPDCPVDMIHGEPREGRPPTAVSVNWTDCGQAAAVVVAGPS